MLELQNKVKPEIKEGGIGQRYVTIGVRSSEGVALDYLILAYSNNKTATTTETPLNTVPCTQLIQGNI